MFLVEKKKVQRSQKSSTKHIFIVINIRFFRYTVTSTNTFSLLSSYFFFLRDTVDISSRTHRIQNVEFRTLTCVNRWGFFVSLRKEGSDL